MYPFQIDLIRKISPTQIQYLLISSEKENFSFILPPKEFDNMVIDFVSYCPKDLLQLHNGLKYYEYSHKCRFDNPTNFGVIYDRNILRYAEEFCSFDHVKLFFLDRASIYLKEIINTLKTLHKLTHFYVFFNDGDKENHALPNIVSSPLEFLLQILSKQEEITKLIGLEVALYPSVIMHLHHLLTPHQFSGAVANSRTINNLIGNFDLAVDPGGVTEEEFMATHAKAAQKAQAKSGEYDRQLYLVDQIGKLDYMIMAGVHDGIFKVNSNAEPVFAPLILIAPYTNPDVSTFFKLEDSIVKNFVKVMKFEQGPNYTTDSIAPDDPEVLIYGSTILKKVHTYLDNIGYLHASFDFSPVVRLPLKGVSINRELSFFRPDIFGRLQIEKNRISLKKNIEKFGKTYRDMVISKELEVELIERNRQIVAITDIPIEWLQLDGIPFAFTHDICRMPVVSYRGLMSNFANNCQFAYRVSKETIKRTLVIYGSDEPMFRTWQAVCNQMSQELGFKTMKCSTVEDVKNAIIQFKPELLIFDCHGGYDKENGRTVLYIGKEQLDGDKVVEFGLSAPLVFLSACGTAPTYGSINTIANAFFEAGSFAVTTTYLPVEINSSSVLYIRLLRKLLEAANKGHHKNWLEFVSHIIRSSYVLTKYFLARQKAPKHNEALLKESIDANVSSMMFHLRRELFLSIDKRIIDRTRLKLSDFDSFVPEYLFYSTLGRADLIYFSEWLDAFRKNNGILK